MASEVDGAGKTVAARSPLLLRRSSSRLLLLDMQEKLLRVVPRAESLTANCRLLVRGAKLLGVPVDATEQYPHGLGATVAPLRGELQTIAEKLRFSAGDTFDWSRSAANHDRFQVIVAGIESHICVLQTTLDLVAAGYDVTVAADAVASRREIDHETALARMRDHGVTVSTVEAILFEWCESAEAAEFRELSQLVKSRDPS
jgi:isochorismate hydrolase